VNCATISVQCGTRGEQPPVIMATKSNVYRQYCCAEGGARLPATTTVASAASHGAFEGAMNLQRDDR
jgi:hypothetical protein